MRRHLWLCWVIVMVGVGAGRTRAQAPDFPLELVRFQADDRNPVLVAGGAGQWDVRIRERGWILKEGDHYRLWYTGYDGTREGEKHLGLATSTDGIRWTKHPSNPIYAQSWVEDVCIVKDADRYLMVAEGKDDQAQLLTSPDGIKWTLVGRIDVRLVNGQPIPPGPYGTPILWKQPNRWLFFYERQDKGVWVAQSTDLKVWTNLHDEPILLPGPEEYDQKAIALNQIVEHAGRYYGYYHANAGGTEWCSCVAVSSDLIDWRKYPHNPILRANKSSPFLVPDAGRFRLYTTHDKVQLHHSGR